jgi:AraC family transcriptional regulator
MVRVTHYTRSDKRPMHGVMKGNLRMKTVASAAGLQTGVRSYDLSHFSSIPTVTEVLPFRSGTGALVRHRMAGPCALECTQRPDHIVFVALESYSLRARLDKVFDGQIVRGSTGVFPAGIDARWESESGVGSVIHMHVAPARMGAVVEAEPAFRRCGGLETTFNRDDPVIASLAHAIRDEIQGRRPGCRLLLDTLFQALCIHLLRRYSQDPTTCSARPYAMAQNRLARAQEFIHDNVCESIGIDEIAAAAGLSPYHFSRSFKEAVGIPPYQYVRMKRVERARRLLEQSDIALSEIAASCGFASHQHMADAFRDHLGISPGRYRRAHRESD